MSQMHKMCISYIYIKHLSNTPVDVSYSGKSGSHSLCMSFRLNFNHSDDIGLHGQHVDCKSHDIQKLYRPT